MTNPNLETNGEAVQRNGDLESTLAGLAGSLFRGISESSARVIRKHVPEVPLADKGFRMDEARYRTLVELLPAITFMAVFEEGLSEVYVSPQIEQLLGYTQRQWAEDPVLWYERLHPDDRERWNGEFARTVSSAEPLRSTYRFLARDGRIVWIHGEARIVRDKNGVPLFIHGMGFDVTRMKEAEERVVQYAEKLKQTNFELEQFAYVASHDLQEPLRSISAYADVLTQEYAGKLDANADKYLCRIRDGATRMKTLIQGLLQFSRVGHADTPFDPTNIGDALSEAMVNLDAAIRQNRAVVTHDALPRLMANRTYLSMLFQNLIGNAIKFRSQQPPRIHVSAARNNDFWVFSVRDNGLGIDPKYHQRIFGIFQRLHTQKEYAGTGIGLALCKKIIELHGGILWVESELNKGSTFKFTLPVDRPVPTK